MSDALFSVTSGIADYLLTGSLVAVILVTATGVAIRLSQIKAPVHRI